MYNLFKGFVPTKNKECLMKFKNKSAEELKTLREVAKLDEYAGILNDNTVLIDIDDYEQSEILMQIVEDLQLRCRVYETTRGKHFLFLNEDRIQANGTHKKLACGLESDIKLGTRSSYSILKYNGKERTIIYDIFEGEEYEPVPKWLLPITTKLDFLELQAGDGRNQALFNYILTLQSYDFTVDEARECIRIINKYVLKDCLTDEELDVILRDDAFKKPIFFKKNVFLFDKFATFIKNNNNIIKINDVLHVYDNGVYVRGDQFIERKMIEHIPNLSDSKRKEVLKYLNLIVKDNREIAPAHLIAFKNGVYNMETDTLEDFNPGYIITNKINYNYNPAAYSEIMDKTLNKLACNNAEVRALLEMCVGYCFYRRSEMRKCFILTGEKRNGKSTYLALINQLLGRENISNLDLKELGERFKTAELFGKLANIGDDIDGDFIASPAVFKKLVSGNPINVERKGGNPFDFSNYAKLIFSANDIPRIKDRSGAVIDRLIIIPFDAVFDKNDAEYDPYIKYKLIKDDALEYLIILGVKALKVLLENQAFPSCEKVQKSIKEYEEQNNPVLAHFAELEKSDFKNKSTKECYKRYNEFCYANGFTPISNIEFSKQVKKRYTLDIQIKSVSGRKYKVFI